MCNLSREINHQSFQYLNIKKLWYITPMVVSLFSYWMKHIFLFSDFCNKKKLIKVCMQVVLQFLLFPLLNLLMFKTISKMFSRLILNHKFTIKQIVGLLKIYSQKGPSKGQWVVCYRILCIWEKFCNSLRKGKELCWI